MLGTGQDVHDHHVLRGLRYVTSVPAAQSPVDRGQDNESGDGVAV